MADALIDDLDLTAEEMSRFANAFTNPEFKNMLFDYLKEIQDPKNRELYKEEMIKYEAERGVEVKFINPEPCFVVKTSVDGTMKGFINISKSSEIKKPTFKITTETNPNWRIPFLTAPPSRDRDNKGAQCIVYNVVFNSDMIDVAEKNPNFKKHLIQISFDAIEKEFNVELDRTNRKCLRMKCKSVPPLLTLRTPLASPINDKFNQIPFQPAKPVRGKDISNSEKENQKIIKVNKETTSEYTTPRYKIIEKVESHPFSNDILSKTNISELIIEIDLPLLSTSKDCILDVESRRLFFKCNRTVQYKLDIILPYPVKDELGHSTFNVITRKLIVYLPVSRNNRPTFQYIQKPSTFCLSTKDEMEKLFEGDEDDDMKVEDSPFKMFHFDSDSDEFLNSTVKYITPKPLDRQICNDQMKIIFHIRDVEPLSAQLINTKQYTHMKFFSYGKGPHSLNFAFYVKLNPDEPVTIKHADVNVFKNNVILTIQVDNHAEFKSYFAGLDENSVKMFRVHDKFVPEGRVPRRRDYADYNYSVQFRPDNTTVELRLRDDFYDTSEDSSDEENAYNRAQAMSRRPKPYKKRRTHFESFWDSLGSASTSSTKRMAPETAVRNENKVSIPEQKPLSMPGPSNREMGGIPEARALHSSDEEDMDKKYETEEARMFDYPSDASLEDHPSREEFLKASLNYRYKGSFDWNILGDRLTIILHISKVEPISAYYIDCKYFIHLQCLSYEPGYGAYYGFYVELIPSEEVYIKFTVVNVYEENIVLIATLKKYSKFRSFYAGLNKFSMKKYYLYENFEPPKETASLEECTDMDYSVDFKQDEAIVELKFNDEKPDTCDDEQKTENKTQAMNKKQKKRNKKRRSFSESCCDSLESATTSNAKGMAPQATGENKTDGLIPGRKQRSMSESCDEKTKGILKTTSRYSNNVSRSCSSINLAANLPLSEKTVRFNDVIRTQLFRLDSSILGQRKKNQKKRIQKQRALQRRLSESDASDYKEIAAAMLPKGKANNGDKLQLPKESSSSEKKPDDTDDNSGAFPNFKPQNE